MASLLCSPGTVGLPEVSHVAPHPALQPNHSPSKSLPKLDSFPLFLLVFSLFSTFSFLSSFCLSASACLTSFLPLVTSFVSFFLSVVLFLLLSFLINYENEIPTYGNVPH